MGYSPTHTYLYSLQEKLTQALAQNNKIQLGAQWIAESIKSQGWIYASGTGHSHILAEEIFYRAGGFARVIPILDENLMLHIDATKSSEVERSEGYASTILKNFDFSKNDTLILASNSGRNAVPIEMAMEAKRKDAKTICVTNLNHSQNVNSRHSSGKRLFEICDLFLDNFGEIGDAGTTLEGISIKMGATSTIIGSAILNALMMEAAAVLIQSGHSPELFNSSNTDLGEKANQAIIEKYKNQVKGL